MGEKGAHLTANLQIKPSIFEVVASDSLNSTFYPAIKRLVNFFVIRNPEKYKWMMTYYDELYLVFNGILQHYYLKTNHGSLSEVFYGISRYSIETESLTKSDRYLSVMSLILLPYIKIKIEEYILKNKNQIENPTNSNELCQKYFVQMYKISISAYECLKIVQYISFMSNVSTSHTPIMRFMKIGLKYIPPDDTNSDWSWSAFLNGRIKTAAVLSGILFRGLELSAFFLQFLQWWQLESSQKNITNLPIPPPPANDPNGHKYMGLCPICLQKYITPTVISISGFVYCYKCIMKHFEDSHTCPVTNYPASIDDLIRIFDD